MNQTNFTISTNAAKRIAYLLSKEKTNKFFRVSVNSGGCSGLRYDFELTNDIDEKDHLIEIEQAKIIVDDISLNGFLSNSILDFTEDLGGSQFEIKNPNASASCGCGNSFAI